MSDVFNKHFCTYCQDEIKSLKVKCVECSSFELCLQCFSAGAEIGPHKKDHAYQFVDSVACDIFRDRSGWSGREELYLLNAIEHYGYGNWLDISQHISTRSPEEAEEEYASRYVGGDIGRHTWVAGLRSRCRLTDLTAEPTRDPPLPPALREEHAEQLEYLPLRDQFEVEFDYEAEYLVANLTPSTDDDELEIALNCALVEIYTKRLRERNYVHKVIRDYDLISKFFNEKTQKKKVAREERELSKRLQRLCREHEQGQVVTGRVMKQRRLAHRLTELLWYRRNGLVRLEEIPHFDQERQLRHNGKPGSTVTGFHGISGSKKEKTSSFSKDGDQKPEIEPLAFSHLLNESEMQICTSTEMKPSHYISLKTLMITDAGCREVPADDGDADRHRRAVLDHLAASGWLADVVNVRPDSG